MHHQLHDKHPSLPSQQRSHDQPKQHPLVRLAERTQDLMRWDNRVGHPPIKPDVDPENFGWLFPAQQILLNHVLREETRVVVQLGAYLGKTTLFIAEHAPNAVIFVVDPWDNDLLKAEPSLNKNFGNIDLFERVDFYPTFLANTFHLAARPDGRGPVKGTLVGVVPLRMSFEEGLELLKTKLELRPDVLYWEGFPHEEGVFNILQKLHRAFPGVVIVGDGYNYPEVQKGVQRASSEIFKRRPYVELGKCWTFARVTVNMLKDLRAQYQAPENRAERTVLSGAASKASFKDLLSGLKCKSDERKQELAEDRDRRRRQEKEERDRRLREEEEAERRREDKEARKRYNEAYLDEQEGRRGDLENGGIMRGRGPRRGRGGGEYQHRRSEDRGARSKSRSRDSRRSRSPPRARVHHAPEEKARRENGTDHPPSRRQDYKEEGEVHEDKRWMRRRRGEDEYEAEDEDEREQDEQDEEEVIEERKEKGDEAERGWG